MGYEITQFVGEVDVEFHCCICMMVLQRPLESPCDHAFCSECISKWLSQNLTCPVDRTALTLQKLKPPGRIVRNLLNKFQIKCDFQPDGCAVIVRLEHLTDHVNSCEYNPEAEVVCDKGCNIKMLRRDYNANDCDTHLADEAYRLLLLSSPSKWQVCHNINISTNETKLSSTYDYNISYAQWKYPIDPRNSSIKVEILGGFIDIGFSPQGHPIHVLPGRNDSSIGYSALNGQLWVNGKRDYHGRECTNGDIVEIGINFPSDFINDGNSWVELFLLVNGRLISNRIIKMPSYAIFPMITMWGTNAKVKYLEN